MKSRFSTTPFPDLFQAALLEFVGTTFFLILGLGGIQSAAALRYASGEPMGSSIEQTLYISTCMGLSLLVSAWMFYRVTGALFNPNISLALLIVGVIDPARFVMYCIAQMLGAIAASGIVVGLSNAPLAVNTALTDTTYAKGVFIEMFITAALVMAVLMLAAEKHEATPFAPIGIGLTLFAAHLWAVYQTGAAMNVARAFGPAVVTGFPDSGHWVYWIGDLLGSLLGAGFYALLKHYKYWRINPGQDASDHRQSPTDPVEKAKESLNNVLSNNSGESPREGSGSGTRASPDEQEGMGRALYPERRPGESMV
ncbi:putative aquaporin 1 [Pterulicium gracile]|uniref:Putative aquaporin 1 n=1 Tax=Pterulicium gracile TaxID=1884261 RepID=A0A5C3QXJ5_9AGAR|nr:putative aquaporin 1 [Pterula gracilis]